MDTVLALVELEQLTWKTIEEPLPTAKSKRSGSSACALQAEHLEARPAAVDNTIDAVAPNLTVKRKAFNTFATLFRKPVIDTLPSRLRAPDIKKAMVYVGFSAERLQESA